VGCSKGALEKLVDTGKKKVLVTGGLGYLGGRIVESLSASGMEIVIGSHRKFPDLNENPNKCNIVFIDLLDEDTLEIACQDVFAIIHLAAMNYEQCAADPEQALLVNGLGTLNLINSANKQGVDRFIYFSTIHVYGPNTIGSIDEESICNPTTSYALTHKIAEDHVISMSKAQKMKSVIFRLSNAVGFPMHKTTNCWTLLVNNLCKQAASTGRIKILSSQFDQRDFIPITDVCNTVLFFLDGDHINNQSDVYNLTRGESISFREISSIIVKIIKREKGFNPTVYFDNPSDEVFFKNTTTYSRLKLDKLQINKQGSVELEISELIKRCFIWFDERGLR